MRTLIELKAIKIKFSPHSISYVVEPVSKLSATQSIEVYPFYSNKDIVDKDLIPKAGILCFNASLMNNFNNEVCFKPHNVTPQFYLKLMEKEDAFLNEFSGELDAIYQVGDIIGYILV